MNQVPENVVNDYVAFLYPMNAVGFDHQAVIQADLCHLATAHPSQADGCYTHFFRLNKSLYEIVRVSAGREADQSVSGARLRDQLSDKDMLEADVVSHGRHHRPVSRKIDCGQGNPAGRDRMQKLDSHMRCIAARAAIAHRKQAAVSAIDVGDRSRGGDHFLSVPCKERVNYYVMMCGLLRDGLEERSIHRCGILFPAVQERIQPFQVWILRQTHYVHST